MSDYTFSSLTTAVDLNDPLVVYEIGNENTNEITRTNGGIPIKNITKTDTTPTTSGFLFGRRPVYGQLFPRGV